MKKFCEQKCRTLRRQFLIAATYLTLVLHNTDSFRIRVKGTRLPDF